MKHDWRARLCRRCAASTCVLARSPRSHSNSDNHNDRYRNRDRDSNSLSALVEALQLIFSLFLDSLQRILCRISGVGLLGPVTVLLLSTAGSSGSRPKTDKDCISAYVIFAGQPE